MKNVMIFAATTLMSVSIIAADVPSPCVDFIGNQLNPIYYTCQASLAAFDTVVGSETPTPTAWDPASCDATAVFPPTTIGVSNYVQMETLFATPGCCGSYTTTCDTAKAVPQMCSGGDSDESTSTTCKLSKAALITTLMPASNYPIFTEWNDETCKTDLATGLPVSINMATYAAACCTSMESKCPLPIATVPDVCSEGAADFVTEGSEPLSI